jgi:hypothetical protein
MGSDLEQAPLAEELIRPVRPVMLSYLNKVFSAPFIFEQLP